VTKNLDTRTLLGEDAGPRHSPRPRSFREVALGLVGDDRSQWERWCDEFEQRVAEAMKHPHRTFGSPRGSASQKGD
jgi:hypothetical protein